MGKQKEEDLAASLNIPVEELDVGITMPDAIEKARNESMSQCRTLSIKNENQSWLQRTEIVYIHLHQKIGGRIPTGTAKLTGANINTLLGWLVQTRFIEGWIDLVECMTAGTALQSLPLAVQDLISNVNPESKVDVQRFKNRIKADGNQLKLLFQVER
jgi:hypothetical protein